MSSSIVPPPLKQESADPAGSPHLVMFRGGRPLKRWRYVGVFCEQAMACAARVQVGPARQAFWALWPREDGRLRERTHRTGRGGAVELGRGCLRVREDGVELELALQEEAGWQARCPHGRGEVWTRKQAGVRAHGTLALDGGPPQAIEARAVIDDTAGYHARRTEWRWSAGVGTDPSGVALAWNLVAGVNDPPKGSERAVWVDGIPREAPPVDFTPDLTRIRCEDGSELRFAPEAERRRRENLLLVRSDYRAPFGVFSGTLPGGIELAHGLGVVEHHRAWW
jgi:Protein of unknown function (DUF2804)